MIRATAAAAAAAACIDAQQNASTYRCRACGTTPRQRPDEHSEGGLQDSLAAGAMCRGSLFKSFAVVPHGASEGAQVKLASTHCRPTDLGFELCAAHCRLRACGSARRRAVGSGPSLVQMAMVHLFCRLYSTSNEFCTVQPSYYNSRAILYSICK